MSSKKAPHIFWVGPPDKMFFRSQGEVKCRPGSVIPKLLEQGFKIDVLLSYDPTLLPKTKLTSNRITRHSVVLDKEHVVPIIKLSRGNLLPGIYMMDMLTLPPVLTGALLAKVVLSLARQLKRAVDVFHVFDSHAGLLPLYLHDERAHSRLLRDARTFVTVNSLREFGTFAPATLNELGIASRYFTPDGMEFYGKGSMLKAALQFCDRVAVVESNVSQRKSMHRSGLTMDGVLAANAHKTIQWLSERSVRAYLDMYRALLKIQPDESFIHFSKQLTAQTIEDPVAQAVRMWGPFPPERYGSRIVSFLVQSPKKAYVFWEWANIGARHLGVLLENESTHELHVLVDGAASFGEHWIDVIPSHVYSAVLAEKLPDGSWRPLLRSSRIRVPRNAPSDNTQVVFVDVRTRSRTPGVKTSDLLTLRRQGEGSSAWEWRSSDLSPAVFSIPTKNPSSPGV